MKLIKAVIIILILVLGFFLRHKNYATVPHPGESLDEYSTTWVGMSLLKIGSPVGGLGVGGYENKIYKYINPDFVFQTGIYANPVVINQPWFDHPPMAGLILGGWSLVQGADNFASVSVRIVRQPMVVLGVLSLGLVIWLAIILFDYLTGVIAGLIYAVSPTVVVGSRMAQIENMLIPIFLIGLILSSYYLKNKNKKLLLLMGIIAGSAIWFKLIGIGVLITMLMVVGRNEKKILLGLFFPFVIGYLLYGYVIDFEVFKNVFMANSSRFYGIGPQAVFDIFTNNKFSNTRYLTDGWIVAGWIAFFVASVKDKQFRLITVSTIVYMGMYLFFGNYSYGWYLLPLWPMVLLGLSRLIRQAVNGENLEMIFLVLIAPIGVGLMKYVSIEQFQKFVNIWRLGIGGGLLLSIISKGNILMRIYILLLFIFAVCLSINFVWNLDIQGWFEVS